MSDYPYPVLRKDLDDYSTSVINCDIACTDNGNAQLILRSNFTLFDNEIESMLRDGVASYCLVIECRATNCKEFVKSGVPMFMYKLVKSKYADKVTITPGIVANQDIIEYRNENLNEDYRETDITLPRGAWIAQAEQVEVIIFRDSNESVESICKFEKGSEYNYYDSDDYIHISLPEDKYAQYCSLLSKECDQIITTIFVIPVIQDIVQKYWKDEKTDFSYRWFVVLDKRIKELYPGNLERYSAFEITMMMLSGMMMESVDYVEKHYGGENVY